MSREKRNKKGYTILGVKQEKEGLSTGYFGTGIVGFLKSS